jgi:hypothetical protein
MINEQLSGLKIHSEKSMITNPAYLVIINNYICRGKEIK